MPSIRYSIQCKKNDSPVSPAELVNRYFFGIPIVDQAGNIMNEESLEFYINAAVASVEGFLNLKMKKQIIEETLSYNLRDFKAWGFCPTSFPVIKAHALTGFIGNIEQVVYPAEWLSTKRTNDPTGFHRSVYMVPTSGNAKHNTVAYSGITPHAGWFGQPTIPNYWTIKYCTSFEKIPEDILDFVGKLAAINVFHQLGDIILGAGIASQSIGIDGLSQSISTTSSATNAGYGARVTGYITDLKGSKDQLKEKYDGMVMMSL
jgi:hypothetical protein